MTTVNVTATAQDSLTSSAVGRSFQTQLGSSVSNRETQVVTSTESTFTFQPVTEASILIIRCIGVANVGTGDPTKSLHWGFSSGVYDYELYPGESAVVRLRAGGARTQVFWESSDGVTPTTFQVEAQVWNQ